MGHPIAPPPPPGIYAQDGPPKAVKDRLWLDTTGGQMWRYSVVLEQWVPYDEPHPSTGYECLYKGRRIKPAEGNSPSQAFAFGKDIVPEQMTQFFGDQINVGTNSQALGYDIQLPDALWVSALGNNIKAAPEGSINWAVLLGQNITADGNYPIAIGSQISVSGSYATVIGSYATAKDGVAIGSESTATGRYSTAIGMKAKTTADYSAAIGYQAQVTGANSTALGQMANASADEWAVALGGQAMAMANRTTVVGGIAQSAGEWGTALGALADAEAEGSTALGARSYATGARSVAIGQDASTDADDQGVIAVSSFQVGNTGIGPTEVVLHSPDGARWALRVDNTGALATTKLA